MLNNIGNRANNALRTQKEKLLKQTQYYENRIENFSNEFQKKQYYLKDESLTEEDFPSFFTVGPSRSELKTTESSLHTCIQATQELTGVTVLQSQVNVLIEPPTYEREDPRIIEEGTWREVTAECRVDLIPFSITFYTFQSNKKFAPLLFRGLQVLPVKPAQEAELSKSVLPETKTPSDAVEVLTSYASAYRSRRSTLARLADKYASSLFMEPLADGGYLLKCANLLELSWRLENKISPVAPFHHKMSFDLEYIDETNLKTIREAHKKLSDPTVDTDERTLHLDKIITTCLQAKK